MPPRKTPSGSLSPQDALASSPGGSASGFQIFPRSTSPGGAFTGLFSKPSKWFKSGPQGGRSASNASEPRSSTGSGRRPKISKPTDPRPILPSLHSEPYISGASRSVLDLSVHSPIGYDSPSPSSPSAPRRSGGFAGSGDLRSISRKTWSRSVDDLGSYTSEKLSSPLAIDTTFHEKIENYRSLGTPTSPTPINAGGQYPFPNSPSASGAGARSLASPTQPPMYKVSPSTPLLPGMPPQQSASDALAHVHVRSKSFTPKLSVPKAALIPASPKRKGSASSASSEREGERHRERTASGDKGSASSGASSRGAFPFSFGAYKDKAASPVGTSSSEQSSVNTGVSRATPAQVPIIVEPDDADDRADDDGLTDSRRISQIVHQSGFLNRFMNFAPDRDGAPAVDAQSQFHWAHAASSSGAFAKGWKPFKVVLKGSKVYFYKPPGDRAASAKELFPTGMAAIEDEDEGDAVVEDESAGTSGTLERIVEVEKGRRPHGGRAKRAYWGRRTHPDLVRSETKDKRIQKGTLEALLHEAVFATTFQARDDDGEAVEGELPEDRKAEWQAFASGVLLCLPHVADAAKVEGELTRCCNFLVSGAEDSVKDVLKARVAWLAKEYLRWYGEPVDKIAWDEWTKDADLDLSPSADVNALTLDPKSQAPPQDSVTPFADIDLPASPSTAESPTARSMGGLMSLVQALQDGSSPSWPQSPVTPSTPRERDVQPRSPASPSSSNVTSTSASVWAALERDGLTRDTLLAIDPNMIARSLGLYHERALAHVPADLLFECIVGPRWSSGGSEADATPLPFFGTNERPHWLTKLVLMQILFADVTSSVSSRKTVGEARLPTSRTHSRSGIISTWALVGELCRQGGDACSWRAIAAALCSRPIARLCKAWKRVDEQALGYVEAWAQLREDSAGAAVKQPQRTPWGGDAKSRLTLGLNRIKKDGKDAFDTLSMNEVRQVFQALQRAFAACSRLPGSDDSKDPKLARLVNLWQATSTQPSNNGFAAKISRIDQFMSLSLVAEPRYKGIFEPYFRNPPPTAHTHSLHPLVPLLFPEPLPTITFVDRSVIWRGRVESDVSSTALPDADFFRQMQRHLQSGSRRRRSHDGGAKWATAGGVDLAGTVIAVDEELRLLIQSSWDTSARSRPPSRPPSRAPSRASRAPSVAPDGTSPDKGLGRNTSIRVNPSSPDGLVRKTSSANLDRKASMAKRSSLPSLSRRSTHVNATEPTQERPLSVLVQAGTLDRLVNILVHGLERVTVSASDDSGEAPLREKTSRELKVDREEFSKVWWSVFRSFVTPLVFFELLRKRYVGDPLKSQSSAMTDVLRMIRVRCAVLHVLDEWIRVGGGAQDALDDGELYGAIQSFLDSGVDHHVPSTPGNDDSNLQEGLATFGKTLAKFRDSFELHTRKPVVSPDVGQPRITRSHAGIDFGHTPPDIDATSPEDLVRNLDAMASAALGVLMEEDLFVTADLLEVQTVDRTGWFLQGEPNSLSDDIEIQSIHSYLYDGGVEPSPLISEMSTQDRLYRLLPPGVRTCLRAHDILRRWLIYQVAGPRLGLRVRQARIASLLQAVEICRAQNVDSTEETIAETPCIRSFVESIISSALLSPESRAHYRAWQNVAVARGANIESMSSLFMRPTKEVLHMGTILTVDIGWVLERILDIVSIANLVDEAGRDLINFEKRRNIFNLVTSIPSSSGGSRSRSRSYPRDMERLNRIEKEVNGFELDLRSIREEAAREATATVTGSASKRTGPRPFQRIILLQQEKNKRDRSLRDRLLKEKKMEQSRSERREDQLNRAMMHGHSSSGSKSSSQGSTSAGSANVARKEHRNKKSVSTAFNFLTFMRPISSAFTSESLGPSVRRTAAELDFVISPSMKPSLVLSMADARAVRFVNNERSWTFRLDTEDGGRYLLQAPTRKEMNNWIEVVGRMSKIAARRRLTWIGTSPKPQVKDHLPDRPQAVSKDPRAVFGVDLAVLVHREAGDDHDQAGVIPFVIQRCLAEVEHRGFEEVGIYRIAGAQTEIASLRDAFNRGECLIEPSTDINAVCDLIKTWLRQLPEAVFPTKAYFAAIDAAKVEDLDARLTMIRRVVHDLPQEHFDLLKRIAGHLYEVTEYESQNQMSEEALAIVFSPNLLRSPVDDFGLIMGNMGATIKIIRALITHFHVIFDDSEGEQEDEEEHAPVIQEEDEAATEEESQTEEMVGTGQVDATATEQDDDGGDDDEGEDEDEAGDSSDGEEDGESETDTEKGGDQPPPHPAAQIPRNIPS